MALWSGFLNNEGSELSLLHGKHLLVVLFIPTKYKGNPLKNKGNILLWKKVHQKVNLV